MPESTSQSLAAGQDSVSVSPSENDATEALAHLAKMSGTGSSFGANEYVAISPLAIIALLLGFASALSVIISLFLFIPVIGIIFGVLALRQIRHSNGTQAGVGFAISGLVLCTLIGGGVMLNQAIAAAQARADSEKCAAVLTKFGEEIRAQHYDAIYNDMTTQAFRTLVPAKRFRDTLAMFRVHPYIGQLESIRWAGNAIDFEPVAESDAKFAYAMMLIKFEKAEEPAREMIKLTNREGSWKIEVLPQLFPDSKAKKG